MNELVKRSYDESAIFSKIKMAEKLAKSSLVPQTLRGKAEDIFLILQLGYEMDIPPIQALNSIYVVHGTPSCSSELMLTQIYRNCPNAVVKIEKEGSAQDPVVKCTMARSKDKDPFTAVWNLEKAKQMGLLGKDNWKKQPGLMLKWRAVSEAARTIFPDVIKGLYIPDEAEDIQAVERPTAADLNDRFVKASSDVISIEKIGSGDA